MCSKKLQAFSAWLVIGVFYIYQYILQSVLSVIRVDIQDHFSANSEQFALLTAAFLYAYAAVQLPAGMALDRYGPRWIMTAAVLCCASGCYLFGHTDSYFWALTARVILGASSSFAFLGCLCVVALLFDPKYYAFMAGLTIFLGTFGAGLAQNETASWVTALGSWHDLFGVFSLIGLGIAVLVFIAIPERPEHATRIERADLSMGKQLWQIMTSPYAWITGLYASLVYMPSITLGETWGYGFLIDGYGIEPDQAYQIVPKIFFGLAIGGPIYGYLEGRFWTPFLIIFSNIVVIFLTVIVTTPTIAMTLSVSSWSMIFFLIGMMACGLVFSYTRIKEAHPKEVIGTATGFIHGINAVCWAGSQQWMGRILDNQIAQYGRLQPLLEDYLVAMNVIIYGLILCLPFALIMALIRPQKAPLIIQAVTEKDLHTEQ